MLPNNILREFSDWCRPRFKNQQKPPKARRLSFQQLEIRRLLANVDCLPFDVNGDKHVTPVDVLQIVNALNSGEESKPEHDVNQDGKTSPVDVLQIINHLNAEAVDCVFNTAPTAEDIMSETSEDVPLTIAHGGTDVDGDTLLPSITRQPSHGAVTIGEDGIFRYVPAQNFYGSDSFTYRVNDGQADSEEAAVTITVTPINDPTTVNDKNVSLLEDEPAIINVLADATDADNDFLTPTVAIPPSNGTLVLNPDQTYTYTPNLNFHGTDTFTYEVDDGAGKSSTATVDITVTPLNDAPVATNDTATTREDEQVIFNVLTNDKDADSDLFAPQVVTSPSKGKLILNADSSFTYTPDANQHGADSFTYTINDGTVDSNVATVAITVTSINDPTLVKEQSVTLLEDVPTIIDVLADATDADNDVLTPTVAIPPSNGTLVLNPDRSLTYTPKINFYGDDTFTYFASDGTANSNEATVTITVSPVNDPGITPIIRAGCPEDTSTIVYPLEKAKDPEGGLLTLTSITQPQNGTAVLQSNDAVEYVPNPNYFGEDSLTYTVVDAEGAESTGTISIGVIPWRDKLVAMNDVAETDEKTPVTIDILANDINPDRKRILVSLAYPSTSTVVNPDNTLTFTPTYHRSGKTTIEYFIHAIRDDNFNHTADDVSRATVTIDVKATHVLVASDDMAVTNEETPVIIDVLANDSNVGGDDPLRAEAAWGVETTSYNQNGTVIVNADGTLTFTPKLNFHGIAKIKYAMTDSDCGMNCYGGYGHFSTATVTVDVKAVNDAPIAKDDQVTTGVDTPVTVSPLWNDKDVDGDYMRIVSVTEPSHGTIADDDDERHITYIPNPSFAGDDTFKYTMSDGNGGESTATVHVKVNHLPKAEDIVATTPEDTSVEIDVSSYISDLDSADKLSLPYALWAKHGTVSKVSDTVLRYTPKKDYYGDDTFLYTITDGYALASGKVNMTVTPVNDRPIAKEDTVTTALNTSVSIPVLANDEDVDGDSLTVSISTDPANGVVAVNPDGSITYTPTLDFKGKDTFWYTVDDGNSTYAGTKVTVFVGHLLPLQDPELLTDLEKVNADGEISRLEMIALLRSTTDNRAVDFLEINDMQLIVNSTLLTIQTHVRALAGYVLDNDNLANKNYLGKPLGRLSPSDTGSGNILDKRIGEHFFGLDHPATQFTYTKAPPRELFEKPLRAEDSPQGLAGVCYWIAEQQAFILAGLEEIIEDRMIVNGDDTWTIGLFDGKNVEYVTVDNYLPTDAKGNLVYVGSGIPIKDANLVLPLQEKGYAQANEKGHLGQEKAENSYDAISGGWPADVVRQMTGVSADEYFNLKSTDQAALDQALADNWPVTVTTWTEDPRIVNNHVYTIRASGNGYAWINPWGHTHFIGSFSDIEENAYTMIIFDPSKYVSTNAGSSISSENIPVGEPLYASAAPDSFLASSSFDPALFHPSVIDAASFLKNDEDLPKHTEEHDQAFADFSPSMEVTDLDTLGDESETRVTKPRSDREDLFASLEQDAFANEFLTL